MMTNTNNADISNIAKDVSTAGIATHADDANDIESYDKTSRDDMTDTKANG